MICEKKLFADLTPETKTMRGYILQVGHLVFTHCPYH